tara:strand:- start:125 stop:319 length:195 start_codon:yes stop_codon:yes gene_type:complete
MVEENRMDLTPGNYVINKNNNEWGIGQIQSSIDNKITVNFENVGKKVININEINLEVVSYNDIS